MSLRIISQRSLKSSLRPVAAVCLPVMSKPSPFSISPQLKAVHEQLAALSQGPVSKPKKKKEKKEKEKKKKDKEKDKDKTKAKVEEEKKTKSSQQNKPSQPKKSSARKPNSTSTTRYNHVDRVTRLVGNIMMRL